MLHLGACAGLSRVVADFLAPRISEACLQYLQATPFLEELESFLAELLRTKPADPCKILWSGIPNSTPKTDSTRRRSPRVTSTEPSSFERASSSPFSRQTSNSTRCYGSSGTLHSPHASWCTNSSAQRFSTNSPSCLHLEVDGISVWLVPCALCSTLPFGLCCAPSALYLSPSTE